MHSIRQMILCIARIDTAITKTLAIASRPSVWPALGRPPDYRPSLHTNEYVTTAAMT